MKQVVILPSFERSDKKLAPEQKKRLTESLESFNTFLISGQVPKGLGWEKIGHEKYEFRLDIRRRVIVKEERDIFYLVLVGDHNEIKRYLKECLKRNAYVDTGSLKNGQCQKLTNRLPREKLLS